MARCRLGLSALLFVLGTGCTTSSSPRPDNKCQLVNTPEFGPQGHSSLKAEVVVAGLEVPWAIGFLPNGDMLLTERPGQIRMVKDGALTPPLAVLPVIEEGESGLLGLAIDPAFEQNRFFYVYATVYGVSGSEHRIERWRLALDGASAARDKIVLGGIPASRYHVGGRLHFGPDGMLYASTGDAEQPELAHDPSSLAGKILRLTRDGEVPPDNPRPGSFVYMLGVRNAQGFAWPGDGSLFVADHGPSGELGRTGHDEISRAKAGSDLGWPGAVGCETLGRSTGPSLVWERAAPPGGAAIYTGDEMNEWKGSLLVAMLGAKHLHRVVFDRRDPRKVERHEVYFEGDAPTGLGRLREVVMGPDGALYVTTSNCDGRGVCPQERDRIYRIRRWAPPPAQAWSQHEG